MRELVGEPGPTIDLGEQIRNVDVGQETVELPLKRLGIFWNLTFQRRHDQRAVHEPYALELSGASAIGELLELKIERRRIESSHAGASAGTPRLNRSASFFSVKAPVGIRYSSSGR